MHPARRLWQYLAIVFGRVRPRLAGGDSAALPIPAAVVMATGTLHTRGDDVASGSAAAGGQQLGSVWGMARSRPTVADWLHREALAHRELAQAATSPPMISGR
jgi:nitric oxide reductase large subunit